MSRNYDNWERLVGAVLRREKDRRLAYCESFCSSSSADLSSRFSFVGDVHESADLCSENIFFSRRVKAMEYEEIRKATSNFRADSTLRGGHGYRYSVYKGWIDENYVAAVKPGSGIAVAVTVEEWGDEGIAYWLEKKINLSQYRHPNLVIPIGYYADRDRDTRIFVNEFMASGSLDRHLFRPQKPLGPLPWATRMRVAVGAARGLAFLHNLEVPVLYGVLTSRDILLDADFNAKLSKIGIARGYTPYDGPDIKAPWAPSDTYSPYTAPELFDADTLSTKCDVYSFGVVLMELITGRQAYDGRYPAGQRYLMDWARPYLGSKRGFLRIMDTRLEGKYPHKEAYKVGQKVAYTVGQKEAFKVGTIALQCVSSNPRSRPRMAEVVAALEKLYYPSCIPSVKACSAEETEENDNSSHG